MVNINNYNPNEIVGAGIEKKWFEALNMVHRVAIDPYVERLYLMCLDWESYKANYYYNVVGTVDKKREIASVVNALKVKYGMYDPGELK